jgi:acyl-CoA reductase-like NAD-dependent aldehyde dehydrogenase
MAHTAAEAERLGRHLVGGEELGSPTEPVKSPHNAREVVGRVAFGDAALVDKAVAAAAEAGREWRHIGPMARGERLYAAADQVAAAAGALAELGTREMGKPIGEMRGEVARAVAILRYYAAEGARAVGEVIPAARPDTLQYTRRVPLGVVGIITPWNFPVAIPVWKMAPALAYGNTVVWKPAEWSSLTSYALAQILRAALPAGVLNVVLGAGTVVGAALAGHPGVEALSFTGSTGAGRSVAAAAIDHGAKFQLEMGGKNPALVLEDADLGPTVDSIVSGAMRSAGQKCTATSRVIALPGIHRRLVDALAARLADLKVGDPLDPSTYVGPLVSERQADRALHLMRTGVADGARLITGGRRGEGPLAGGWYLMPTLFDRATSDMAIAQEEIFGPAIAVLEAKDLDHAIDIANGVRYGLSASVFTRDLGAALTVVDRLEAGLVRVNEETAGVEYAAPFGGTKASSSHSREQGQAAREFYTEVRTVAIRPAP